MLYQIWQWFFEPTNQNLLLGIIVALILGIITGRLWSFCRKKSIKTIVAQKDEAFLKGVRHLLSDDRDRAIEEFTRSVQVNSDTIETYIALGNLFRSKGDTDRAIHIRRTIILRPNIDEEVKFRTLFDIGLDYRKGGLLDRALEAFTELIRKQPGNLQTLKEIEKLHVEMHDWDNALSTRKQISRLVKGDHKHIMAHYQTEAGKVHLDKGDFSKAKSAFNKASSIDPSCVDAYLHLGDMHFENQEYKKAIAAWKKVVKIAPQFTFLAYRRLEGAYLKMQNLKPVEDFLKECAETNSDAFTHLALARYLNNAGDHDGALKELESALKLDPDFWEARRFTGEILLDLGRERDITEAYRELINHLNVPYLKFQCSNCGFKPVTLQWQCPQCRKWDTITLIERKAVDSPALLSSNDLPSGLKDYEFEEEV